MSFTPFLTTCPLDYKDGFGGKFGVQEDRQDKSAVGWDYQEKVDKHESQKGETSGRQAQQIVFKHSMCLLIFKMGLQKSEKFYTFQNV